MFSTVSTLIPRCPRTVVKPSFGTVNSPFHGANTGCKLLRISNRTVFLRAKKRKLKPSTSPKTSKITDLKPKDEDIKEKPSAPHVPVMLNEVISVLNPKLGGIFIDGTFGLGGHSSALLSFPHTKIFGLDRDGQILEQSIQLRPELEGFKKSGRLELFQCRYSEMATVLKKYEGQIDGILLDIGVSSVQLDTAERGFSYKEEKDGLLDMRMDQSENTPTAADIVNKWPESKLANLIYEYGEEKRSRVIAKAIVERRRRKKITRTSELAQLISSVIPRGNSAYKSPQERTADHSKRTFQALRIEVNKELTELKNGLISAEKLLKPGGTLAVITFHSLEDRIVKDYFSAITDEKKKLKYMEPEMVEILRKRNLELQKTQEPSQEPCFECHSPSIIKPSREELEVNKRARPAKLRAAIRTYAQIL